MALSGLSAAMRTFLLAGLALNIIFSPVKGLIPSRALVAGFFTTLNLHNPGKVKRPLPFRLFLMTPFSDSNTSPTCLRDKPASLERICMISDLVGAAFFFAILISRYGELKCWSPRRRAQNSTRCAAYSAAQKKIFAIFAGNFSVRRKRRAGARRAARRTRKESR